MKKHYRAEDNCLNCGATVPDRFCTKCGQENLELKEPFWHFIGHSIAHYFHFDSKFFSTLKPLLTKPGQLTLDYLAGKRTRYLQPVSMYIFVSIVYFLMVSITSKPDETKIGGLDIQVDRSADTLSREEKLALNFLSGSLKDSIQQAIGISAEKKYFGSLSFASQQHYLDSLKKDKKAPKKVERIRELEQDHTAREDSTYQSYLNRQQGLPVLNRDGFFERYKKKQSIKLKQEVGKDIDLGELGEKYASKLYFLLMPLFAFFVMLNFRRNKRYYIDHLVFTIHFFTAFFILNIFTLPLVRFLPGWISGFLQFGVFCGVIWYIYRGLRVFYQRKRSVTIRKMISLSLLYLLAFSISATIIGMFVFVTV